MPRSIHLARCQNKSIPNHPAQRSESVVRYATVIFQTQSAENAIALFLPGFPLPFLACQNFCPLKKGNMEMMMSIVWPSCVEMSQPPSNITKEDTANEQNTCNPGGHGHRLISPEPGNKLCMPRSSLCHSRRKRSVGILVQQSQGSRGRHQIRVDA